MKPVSVNDNVWVYLTPDGERVLKSHILAISPNIRSSLQEELARSDVGKGWRVFQLFELMAIFGEAMTKNRRAMFERNLVHLTQP